MTHDEIDGEIKKLAVRTFRLIKLLESLMEDVERLSEKIQELKNNNSEKENDGKLTL